MYLAQDGSTDSDFSVASQSSSDLPVTSGLTDVTSSSNHSSARFESCELLNTYAVVVQLILAVLAFSILLLKWYREPVDERRSRTVWLADTTKQLVGAGLVHILNVLFSSLNSVHDACTWYLINFVLDCTVGLILIYAVLGLARVIGNRKGLPSLNSGEYGEPFSCSYWLIQCGVYVLAMLVEKASVLGFMQAQFWGKVADVILPIRNKSVRIVLVMLVVPFIFNALMFWVVDNILKRRQKVHGQTTGELTESLLTSDKGSSSAPDVALRLVGRRYAKLAQETTSDGSDTELTSREQVL